MRGLKLKCSLVTTQSVCFFKYWMKQLEKQARETENQTRFGIINISSVVFSLKDYDFNNLKNLYGFVL